MKNLFLISVFSLLIVAALATTLVRTETVEDSSLLISESETAIAAAPPKKTMRAFRSQAELETYFRELAEQQRRETRRAEKSVASNTSQPAASPSADKDDAQSGKEQESVTNTQHAGVDEGGIVKHHGEHLVILRRGRLFTVAIGDNSLRPISAVDAFAPDIDPDGTWYDEMLISGDTVIVIGYSYQRGGTEVGLFDIDRQGNLRYRSTYHLRSNDYYSSRNYASRLIGNKLIFYTPQYLWLHPDRPMPEFPALRKWRKGATADEFKTIVTHATVYRPERKMNYNYGLALHSVTVCDLANANFDCKATSVVGPAGRVFYVSPKSVYVWMTEWSYNQNRTESRSMLYQMPLDGSAPSALGVSGSPVDQFSFLESADENLNVLVRSDGYGDGMWRAEFAAGDIALMRVPVSSFSDGSENVPYWRYKELPKPEGYTFQNRYVGDYLLYGTGSGWGYAQNKKQNNLYAVRWAEGETREVELGHGVDRIEVMGKGAVVVGTDGKDLHFSSVRLGDNPRFESRYTQRNASQGELRSHGFFYKPTDSETGLLGLPIRGGGRPGYRHLIDDSASILFLRNDFMRLSEVGKLDSRPEKSINDKCRASCVDWYGNARPLFIRGRVFALMGYEIVEGSLGENGIRETRRINYSPQSARVWR